ncbi:hypothetical protein OG884_35265 [Streptosporangium sp. NBC_01755]|uniref:Rv1733c family protein n=1 Tax=Streptosporangium sp. NBC_01755 TaxID=2975949 RepID=UPI002DDB2832|nr:hypothetical protein [Streptosporangium sp. NBC_01755]WSC99978.1 hypothetical protein OG884_35265 [Streptosporangium sp. NBC_01755]
MRSFGYRIRCRLRLRRFDGNPLRRRSDRIETAAVLMSLLLFAAGLWPAAGLGRQAYEDGLRAELAAPHRRLVAAEVVDTVRPAQPGLGERARTVRWTAANGTPRTGQVVLPTAVPVGLRTEIWLDAAGTPTDPPHSRLETVTVAALTAIGVMVWIAMILLLFLVGLRLLLNRYRYAEWERAWSLADQRWHRPKQG